MSKKRRGPLLLGVGAVGVLIASALLSKTGGTAPVAPAATAKPTSTPAPAPQPPRPPTPYERLPAVMARIGQKEIKKEHLRPALEGITGGTPRQEQLAAEMAWMTAKARVQHEVLYREAKQRGVEMSPEDLKAVELLERHRQQAQQAVAQVGIDAADAIQKYRETMVIKRMLEKEFYDKVQVSPEEIQAAYEQSTESYLHPETFRVRHLVVKTHPEKGREHMAKALARIQELHRRATAPKADFAALARAESEAPDRAQGGLLGEFEIQDVPIRNPQVVQLIRNLEPGTPSHPVYTDEGYELVYVEKRTPVRRMTLAEATPLLRKALQYEKGGNDALAWAEELERAAGVELLIPKPPSLDAPPAGPSGVP